MILKSTGIRTERYFIPPFELNESEIVVINLYGGAHYYEIKMELVNIFVGKTKITGVEIFRTLTFVEHFKESRVRRLIYPVTVGEHLRKNANPKSYFASKIYETKLISARTKMNELPGNPRKNLSLYSTLSNTSDIVFDLAGQDPQGAWETYQIVKNNVKNGGSAILIDWVDEMKNDCTTFITIEWSDEKWRTAFTNDHPSS